MIRWTDDEVNYLKTFYLKLTSKEFSVILNRTRKAIAQKLCRLKLRKNGISLKEFNKLKI